MVPLGTLIQAKEPPSALLAEGGSLLIVPQLLSAVELVFGLDVDRQVREERLDELVGDLEG